MKVRIKLLLCNLVPIIALSIVLIALSFVTLSNVIDTRIEQQLITAVNGFNGDVNYLRHVGQNVDLTVFTGSKRTESSIPNVVGTEASSEVVSKVIEHKENLFQTNIDVVNEKYSALYVPTDEGMLFAGIPMTDVNKLKSRILTALLISALLSLTLCTIVTVIISNNISKNIRKVTGAIDSLSKSDLTQDVELVKDVECKDEIKSVWNFYTVLYNHIRNMIINLGSLSDNISCLNKSFSTEFDSIIDNVKNVSVASEEIAHGSVSQADEVSIIRDRVVDMNRIVDESAGSIQMMNEAIENMSNISNETGLIVSDLVVATDNSIKSVNEINTSMKSLQCSIEEILTSIDSIQNIASQTNLLSLNASIEATHAGEAGKGFAVVAIEIRKLSSSVSTIAKNINEIARKLISNSQESSKAMSTVISSNESQKEVLEKMVDSFNSLNEKVSIVSNESDRIKKVNYSLIQSKNAIHDSIEQLASISEENAASTEETSANIQSLQSSISNCKDNVVVLNNLGNELLQQIKEYKLGGFNNE